MRFWKFAVSAAVVPAFLLSFAAPALAQGKKNAEKKGAEEKKAPEGEKKRKKTGEESSKETFDLDAQGTLGAPTKSGDFYDFIYVATEGKKQVRKKAWLKIDSGTTALVDRAVGAESFKEGDSVKMFGKPIELESGGKGYSTGKTHRLQAVRVAISGKRIKVNEAFSDPKDKKFVWCDTSVEKAGKALTVTLDGASHNVSFDKGAAIIQRGDADPKKDIRKGTQVLVQGSNLSEKPEGEKEDRPAFHASQVIVMEKRCQWYEALIP